MRRRQVETLEDTEERRSEAGDTLIEVLMAMTILAITAVALMTAFATAISSSSEHRQLVTEDAAVRAATSEAIADVQASTSNLFGPSSCPIPASFTPTWTLSGSFTVSKHSVAYWNGSQFEPTCTNGYYPQQWTMTVSSGTYHATTSTVITDPSVPQVSGGTTPSQLVFLQPTSTGTGSLGATLSPQPIVAIEDNANQIVYSNASSVTLSIVTGEGGTLSNSCSSVENEGVFSFGNCSINGTTSQIGTYTLKAVDSDGLSSSTTISYTISTAPPAKLVFIAPDTTTGTASSSALIPITVQEQDAFGNPVTGALTVNLSSTSATASSPRPRGSGDHLGIHWRRVELGDLLLRRHNSRTAHHHGSLLWTAVGHAARNNLGRSCQKAGLHLDRLG